MFQAKKFILLIGDVALLYLALWLTLRIRHFGSYDPIIFQKHLLPFSIVFAIWIIIFFINNLYRVQFTNNEFRFYGYLMQTQLINTAVALLFFYLVPSSFTPLQPQTVLLILILIDSLLLLLWRRIFYSLSSSSKLTNKILFIGIDKESIKLIEEIQKKPQLGFSVALIINLDKTELPLPLQAIPQLKNLINLSQNIRDYRINTVVTTTNPLYSPQISKFLFEDFSVFILPSVVSYFIKM